MISIFQKEEIVVEFQISSHKAAFCFAYSEQLN